MSDYQNDNQGQGGNSYNQQNNNPYGAQGQPQQPQYPYPPTGFVPQPPPKGMAVASLVLGIVGVVLGCSYYFGIPLGALAIIFAVLHKKKYGGSGMATAGLVLGIITAVFAVLGIILQAEFEKFLEEFQNSMGTTGLFKFLF